MKKPLNAHTDTAASEPASAAVNAHASTIGQSGPQAADIKLRTWSTLRQALVDDLEAQTPPPWLWWRISIQLLFRKYGNLSTAQARRLEASSLIRLVSTTACCTFAYLWIAFSANMVTSVKPLQIAHSRHHPMTWSVKSLHPDAGRPTATTAANVSGAESLALGVESLALLGVPFIGTLQSSSDVSASHRTQWIANHNGQILAIRLAD
jgi:hypothetical protein